MKQTLVFSLGLVENGKQRDEFTVNIRRLRLSSLLGARYTTDLAPWINSMRKYGSPRLVIPKCRCLSPLECCLGTSPTHAANCRPLWKVRPSAIAATTARLQ